MRATDLVVVAMLAFAAIPASRADADYSKVWAAAKANLPAATNVLFVGDVAAAVIRDGRKALYLAWVTPEVIAISFDPDDKAELHAWIDQKGALAKAPIGAQLAMANTKAQAWGVFALDRVLEKNVPVKAGRGAVVFAAAAVSCEILAVFDTRKAARDTLGDVKKELLKGAYRQSTPDPIKKVLKAIVMKATGTGIAVTATVDEVDLIGAIAAAIHH